jgi:LysR family glycine cleavage system transcriptional activator
LLLWDIELIADIDWCERNFITHPRVGQTICFPLLCEIRSHNKRAMATRLPPLTTLPVLEAAARLSSYSLAAEELHVTHGAVSHQIRSLEEHLGVKLFVRQGRGVALTAEGARFAEAARQALELVTDATEELNPAARANKLVISVLPSFASRWLMPRLGGFIEQHPNLQVSVEATPDSANFITDGVDVGIRFGRGPWPELNAQFLASDSYLAVASPRFRGGKLPKKPGDLANLPLFQANTGYWERWFSEAGLKCEPMLHPIDYNDAAMFLYQATAGEGIALTRRSLVEADLKAKKLVKLFDIEFPSEQSYWLVSLPACAAAPRIRAFREWLIGEIDWKQLRSSANTQT